VDFLRENLHQADVAATLTQDPSALTTLWSDDGVNLGFPVGAPHQNVVYGTEENVRELLRDGGIAGIEIDALFKTVLNPK
jgi:hypothetical protein